MEREHKHSNLNKSNASKWNDHNLFPKNTGISIKWFQWNSYSLLGAIYHTHLDKLYILWFTDQVTIVSVDIILMK